MHTLKIILIFLGCTKLNWLKILTELFDFTQHTINKDNEKYMIGGLHEAKSALSIFLPKTIISSVHSYFTLEVYFQKAFSEGKLVP